MKQFIRATLLLASAFSLAGQTPALAQCKVGRTSSAFGFWTWAANSKIKVYTLGSDFTEIELPFVLKPLQTWNAVSEVTGSGVKFDYVGSIAAPLYCENCLTIMRGEVFDKTRRHATELRAYSAHGDQIMTWAQIVIDPVLTNPEALTNAMAHELGHNFGLVDCYSCKSKSTVMIQFKTANEPNKMEGPTACDVAQVQAAYKELAVRVRPSPTVKEVVDEGEEPEDDDTPVVIKKP